MSKSTYIKELLDCFGTTDEKSLFCPMDVNIQLQKAEKCCEDEFSFHELVWSLSYLTTSSIPDIANSVSQLSKFLIVLIKLIGQRLNAF